MHGAAIGSGAVHPRPSGSSRPTTLDHLGQSAGAVDTLGFDGVLTPTGAGEGVLPLLRTTA
jgi:hypothetical protein